MKPPRPDKESWKIDWSRYKPPVNLPPLTPKCTMPISKNYVGKKMKEVPVSFFQWMHDDMNKYPNSERSAQWMRVFNFYKTHILKQ